MSARLDKRFTVSATGTGSVFTLRTDDQVVDVPGTFGQHGYPETRVSKTVDEFHGQKVADPYRWLEDPDSKETKEWVRRQNSCSDAVLMTDLTPRIRKRLGEVYDYDKQSCPFRRGDTYFVHKMQGLQNQPVLWMASSLAGLYTADAEVLLDLNKEKADGTASMRAYAFSEDARYLAFGVSEGGSDWVTIRVRDVSTREDLSDVIPWVKFSGITWMHDNSGFFYARYAKPETAASGAGTETDTNLNQKLYYHALGTSAEEDVVVCETPDHPKWKFGADMSDDGKILLISIDDGCDPVNRVFYVDLESRSSPSEFRVVKLVDNFDAGYEFVASNDRKVYFKTNLSAPNSKVIAITLPLPGSEEEGTAAPLEAAELVVAETKNSMEFARVVNGDQLVICYIEHAASKLSIRPLSAKGPVQQLVLPTMGCVLRASMRRRHPDIFVSFTSCLHPAVILHHKLSSDGGSGDIVLATFRETAVPGFDANEFETFQLFAPSKDGTRIPMFVVRAKRSAGRPGPTLLYGYGGFNIAIPPYFSALRLPWLKELGGTYVITNIRGGGEYGRAWHDAGKLFNKQNVFDDFCACGEFLIEHGYTTKEQLCSFGGSNGGLLVLATALQRPDLFSAGLSMVPVADMLRFHKFTIGHAWCSDYGNPDESKAEFENLLAYSPLHNVKSPEDIGNQQLPALLISTGDHDDRVSPLHSFKMVATLQAIAGRSPLQTNPLIVRIGVDAGHGAGKPTHKVLDEYADVFAFAARYTGAIWRE